MCNKNTNIKDFKNLKFEEALNRLEDIVEKLENNSAELEEATKLFEIGMQLSDFCQKKLEESKRKIEIIKINENGNKTKEEFTELKDEV
ncbi:MAG: exodeoxyribonuclease VII small subunit [Elusimicrobiota bacterium]|jgi:exodeoxyribonuclease VII small subunit|nr:exodeoxyribonuclease VII small subunit [Elusimicrobiota bacterium]